MQRREFITLLGGTAAWPLTARAQNDRLKRVGVLSAFPDDAEWQSRINAFREGLASLGWIDGRNVRIDVRGVGGDVRYIPALAAEMTGSSPDVILAVSTPVLVALQQETRAIPLVFVNVSDPVDGGFVESMARPGGNVTGFTSFEYSVGGKWLELLKEAVPSLSRALVLLNPENYTSRSLLRTVEAVALTTGVQVTSAGVHNAAEIETAIAAFGQEPNGGVIITPDPLTTAQRGRIAALAATHRLPTIHTFRFFPASGGLMSYGTNNDDLYMRAASYVDRILKGAKVGELPVQNPVKYELVINLKTAKTLGITVPPTLLARADEVIE
jgi:putative tryptophan/tyrosine transport system substrate-binding protein